MIPPESLRSFQQDFGRHVRNPDGIPCPPGIPARRAKIYQELLFNNLRGFVDACFPVCRRLSGEESWERLARNFFRDWRSETPFFSEIPAEFISYVASEPVINTLPAWFAELAHYEWVELSVDLASDVVPSSSILPGNDSILSGNSILRVNPTLRNLVYRWPVHTISENHIPSQFSLTYLLVYRDSSLTVQFAEINALTSRLIEHIAKHPGDTDKTLRMLADEMHTAPSEQWMAFGRATIENLLTQEMIVGSASCEN